MFDGLSEADVARGLDVLVRETDENFVPNVILASVLDSVIPWYAKL